jgi:hypothetical protein
MKNRDRPHWKNSGKRKIGKIGTDPIEKDFYSVG